MTSVAHPLFGRVLAATGFKRWKGRMLLVVVLPDGAPGTIAVEATDVLGAEELVVSPAVFSVEGLRALRSLAETLGARSPTGRGERK